MKKYIIYIIVAGTAVALYAAKKEKQKPATTRPDKGVLVAKVSDRMVSCPRVASQPEFTPVEEKLYEHCNKCGMGVFFQREEGKMSCSYCEITVETTTALP
jgi:ribosomal protein S27AE